MIQYNNTHRQRNFSNSRKIHKRLFFISYLSQKEILIGAQSANILCKSLKEKGYFKGEQNEQKYLNNPFEILFFKINHYN